MGIINGTLYYDEFRWAGPPYPRGTFYAIDTPQSAPRIVGDTGQAGTTILFRDGLIYWQSRYYSPTRFQWFVSDGHNTSPLLNGNTYNWPGPGKEPPAAARATPPFSDSVVFNGTRFYAYDDGSHGTELWMDAGNGIGMLADLYPGPASSFPDSLAIVNGQLVFAATSPDVGRELRTLNLRQAIEPGRPTLGASPPNPARAIDDILIGTLSPGDDRIFGGDGRDYLVGGAGTNLIRGDGGIDRIFANKLLDDLRGNREDTIVNSI
jgi:ELWxxDGT repeat protein